MCSMRNFFLYSSVFISIFKIFYDFFALTILLIEIEHFLNEKYDVFDSENRLIL